MEEKQLWSTNRHETCALTSRNNATYSPTWTAPTQNRIRKTITPKWERTAVVMVAFINMRTALSSLSIFFWRSLKIVITIVYKPQANVVIFSVPHAQVLTDLDHVLIMRNIDKFVSQSFENGGGGWSFRNFFVVYFCARTIVILSLLKVVGNVKFVELRVSLNLGIYYYYYLTIEVPIESDSNPHWELLWTCSLPFWTAREH